MKILLLNLYFCHTMVLKKYRSENEIVSRLKTMAVLTDDQSMLKKAKHASDAGAITVDGFSFAKSRVIEQEDDVVSKSDGTKFQEALLVLTKENDGTSMEKRAPIMNVTPRLSDDAKDVLDETEVSRSSRSISAVGDVYCMHRGGEETKSSIVIDGIITSCLCCSLIVFLASILGYVSFVYSMCLNALCFFICLV